LVPDYDREAVRRSWEAGAADYDSRLGEELATKPFERGVKTVGVDLTKEMLAAARRRAAELPLVVGDALDLPFANGSCGGVVAFYSLHNLRSLCPR
jgi:ubiquinone/menaquinone biosynthesis C-methylase UbiE